MQIVPPPLTFTQKLIQILYLSVACSLLMWILGSPFVNETLSLRTNENLYMNITGNPTLIESALTDKDVERISEAATFWNAIPLLDREELTNHYYRIKENTLSFPQKLKNCFQLFLSFPLTWQCWLIWSLIIPVLMLLRKPGMKLPLILLGLLGIATLFQPAQHTERNHYPKESDLYPFLDKPLSSSILEQKSQLEMAFDKYLADSVNSKSVEEGRYQFLIRQFKNQEENGSLPNFALFLAVISLMYVPLSFRLLRDFTQPTVQEKTYG
jgi:hypothetical protein